MTGESGATHASSSANGNGRWDRMGVCASILCAVHCAVAPLLFLAVPTFAGIWAHPSSHALIAMLVLPLAGTVVLRGYRVHRRRWVAASAALGGMCIVVGSCLPFVSEVEPNPETEACMSCCPQIVADEDGEATLGLPPASIATILGSLLLIAGHLGNLVGCRCCGSSGSDNTGRRPSA